MTFNKSYRIGNNRHSYTSQEILQNIRTYHEIEKYIKECFFNFSPIELETFSNHYGGMYGLDAMKYLLKTYNKWKTGITKTSGQTINRILLCVPKFLNKSQQFEILRFYIPLIIDKWMKKIPKNGINTDNLYTKFHEITLIIKNETYNLDWFVSKVFTRKEINEFLDVLKYTILDILDRSYKNVYSDMNTIAIDINKNISQIDCVAETTYYIHLLKTSFNINHDIEIKQPLSLDIDCPLLVSQYKEEYSNILLEHLLKFLENDAIKSKKKYISLYDIQELTGKLKSIDMDSEFNFNLSASGLGGIFNIKLDRKNKNNFIKNIFKNILWIFLTIIGCSSIILIASALSLDTIILFIILIGVYNIVLFSININQIISAMKEYERKRTKKLKKN